MAVASEILLGVLFIGVGATAIGDVWARLANRLLGMPAPEWALVGRWIGHMPERFVHDPIVASPRVKHERIIGVAFHYTIGVAFAALLLAICGPGWAKHPTLLPALTLGVATVAAPFFIMQPAMGGGIAASRTSRPNHSRLRSLASHVVFGIGLYLSGRIWAWAGGT